MKRPLLLLLIAGYTAFAQNSSYLGPSISTNGLGGVGNRAGAQVDLRFFADVEAIYDTGVHPFSQDRSGKPTNQTGLYGMDVLIGGYGTHSFKSGTLGLDYHGDYRIYKNDDNYDGTDQNLALSYSFNLSPHLSLDVRQIAGTSSFSNYYFAGNLPSLPNSGLDPSTMLFDNRSYFMQSAANANYSISPRTGISFGGNWNRVWRQASALAGMQGYGFNGSIYHAHSKRTSIGVSFSYSKYDYTGSFGQTNVESVQVFATKTLSRSWTFIAAVGAYHADVSGLQSVSVDPTIAAVLGVTSVVQAYSNQVTKPNWNATVTRTFNGNRNFNYSFGYSRGISPGNGIYLASNQESANISASYSGVRRWSFSVYGYYSKLQSIGQQDFKAYQTVSAGTTAAWSINDALHLTIRFSPQGYAIQRGNKIDSYSTGVGLAWSPGHIPLSFR